MQSTDERSSLPYFDPEFCRKVIQCAAASCVVWLVAAVLILGLVDPSNGRCPGWIIYSTNGQASSLWLFVGLFAALPTIWICYNAIWWDRFVTKVYESAKGTYRPFPNAAPKLRERYQPDPLIFPYNFTFVVVSVGWSFFCTIPLWVMLSHCMSLPHYFGYN
ncbi:hypothetical protein NLM31_32700 [Bradyrhizobium sp. CCGUVB4N]|uniref:hypothetical protein n=1 Tax=Bradyrhizobium sp. CCGUVB4N TaxID=2949631 RepID=UPI0020B180FF|nr:hypothetical protein [Bradyrhizobium sp. CCGUVB4N]MCP3385148.1 hypothetical protein [Bradyrhizobium sp. CCGUVB4N]